MKTRSATKAKSAARKSAAPKATASPKRAAKARPEAESAAKPIQKSAAKPEPEYAYTVPNPITLSRNLVTIAAQLRQIATEIGSHNPDLSIARLGTGDLKKLDPLNLGPMLMDLGMSWAANPKRLFDAQTSLMKKQVELIQFAGRRLIGEHPHPLVEPSRSDKRFRHPDWSNNVLFDIIKQAYLLTTSWLIETIVETEGLSKAEREKASFFTQQLANAFSPTNFILTNPEVLRATLATNGENLIHGLDNLLEDIERGHGSLVIRQTDMDAFEVGRNIALTPGKVVYQNHLMQLIQYEPTTRETYRRPLVIFPPWINKYYILDLKPENSFVSWAVDQGYTVFVVSWVNPDETLAEESFEDYMTDGIMAALDAIEKATGEREVTAIGYCIGGTLLGATLAYMAALGDDRIKAATFFAAQHDFTEAGDLKVFIDHSQIESLEERMDRNGGYLRGQTMATTFNLLRSNDLIWSYVVQNYLLGKPPKPFDLLYWNADTTRMPRRMHLFYLQECYLENNLAEGRMAFGGKPLDMHKIDIPIYLQSSREDHIAPYRSVFKTTKLVSGPVRFIIAGSGHIAGVINHPDANKYQYWTNDETGIDDVEQWLRTAIEHPGSWWPDWDAWLSQHSGDKVRARKPGDGALKPIEDAPGSYVKIKSD